MILYKVLTILNAIIILSYCNANDDLLKTVEKKTIHCVAGFINAGIPYDTGFLNVCIVLHFHHKIYQDEKTPEIIKIKFKEYVIKKLIQNVYPVKTVAQISEKESKDIEDVVYVITQFYNEVTSIKLSEVKTPEEFCEGNFLKSSHLPWLLKRRITKCIDSILKKYDRTDKFGNIVQTVEEVLKWEKTMPYTEIDELIKKLPKYQMQYFRYNIKKLNYYEPITDQFSLYTFCNNYFKKKYNIGESPEVTRLANQVVKNTDEENETNATDPIKLKKGVKRVTFATDITSNNER